MDPATLIVAALTAGITEAAKGTVSDAVKASYQNLKKLVQDKFGGRQEAQVALRQLEKKPDTWKEAVKGELVEARLDQDKEVIALAQELLSLVDPQNTAIGKYNVQIAGDVKGFVQGDNANVTMNFGDKE